MEVKTERSGRAIRAKCERYRGRQDIVMGILKVAKHGGKKYDIINKVKMSTAQCNKYLDDLKGAGYVSEESGIWTTTEKGLQVIDACAICQNLMNLT